MLRHRARDVLYQSGLSRHLPAAGLLLDIGSGTGHIGEAILRGAPDRRCVGVDLELSPPPIIAARLVGQAFYPLRASAERLPFSDCCFDAAWSSFVLHHMLVDEQESVLAEVARVLKPGGLFVLLEDTPTTPAERRATLSADRRLNMEPRSAPHHYRSPAEWKAIVPDHGYQLERELAFTRLFPRATLRPVQHRALLYRRNAV